MRIPTSYRPFKRVYGDIKHMPESSQGHKYMLVFVDEISRFVVPIPLQKADAISVSEALIQKVALVFGPPEFLYIDQSKSFSNEVLEYVWKCLKVQSKYVSVDNHASNLSERHIKTISQLLVSQLQGKGKCWHLYCGAAAYSHNTFSSPTLGNLSPYQLLFVQAPFDMSELHYDPINSTVGSHREYLEFVTDRFKTIGQNILDLQTANQQKQRDKNNSKFDKPAPWRNGMLVYLKSPTHSSLVTNSKKIQISYIGPLYIDSMLDSSTAILADLTGKVLSGTYHTKRLKPAFIRVEESAVGHIDKLRKAMT